MAVVQREKQESSSKSRHKYEMVVNLTQRGEGKPSYTFKLHANDIEVFASGQHRAGPEWMTDISETEKLQVFQLILAYYRQRARGASGVKVAALGITEEGHIFIGKNNELTPDDYDRHCAERCMVMISGDREAHNESGEHADTDINIPENKTYKAVYVMGGRNEGEPSIIGPCGTCTDLLAKVMPPEGEVWMLPVSKPVKRLEEALSFSTEAKKTTEVPKGQAWKSTIGFLNQKRHVSLEDQPEHAADAEMQRAALKALSEEMSTLITKERSGLKTNRPNTDVTFARRLDMLERAAKKNMDPEKVNDLHVHQVKMAVYDRLQALVDKYGITDFSPEAMEELITHHIETVRCVTLQLDNGLVFNSTHTKSSINFARPPGELNAIGNGDLYLGRAGVVKAQVMEFNPMAIYKGEQNTSQKAAIERFLKECSKVSRTVELAFMPFNQGHLTREEVLSKLLIEDAKTMNPAAFAGKGSAHPAVEIENLNMQNEVGLV